MASIDKYMTKKGVRYRVRFRDPDGTQSDKRGFQSKREARAYMHQVEVSLAEGTFVPERAKRTPMKELIEEYLNLTAGLSRNTIAQRQSHAKNWVLPKWSAWRVGRIRKIDVENWIEEMLRAGAKPSTIQKSHQLLSAVLNRAVDQRLIPVSPARGVRLPKDSPNRHPYLTYEEVAELASAIDPRYRVFVAFLALTGMRFGEAAALTVDSIDLDDRLISVTRAVTEVQGRVEIGPTKTKNSRVVAYPAVLDAGLRALVQDRRDDDLVFTSPNGQPLRHVTWRRRFWHPAIDAVNATRRAAADDAGTVFRPFPKVTPHDLRHTAASLAVKAGASIAAVGRMLGHANTNMTLNVYVDLFNSDLTDIATTLDEAAADSPLGKLLE